MDRSRTPAPGLILSLEAMIDAAVSSAIDRRLGPDRDTLSVQGDSAVKSTLDRRLGVANTDLNKYISSSLDTAMRERFGPAGSALSAQITFSSPQTSAHHEARTSREADISGIIERESSSAHRYKSPSHDVQYQDNIDFRISRLGRLNDNDEAFTARPNYSQRGSTALEEHSVDTMVTGPFHQQLKLNAAHTQDFTREQAGLVVKLESNMPGKHILGDISSARQALRRENVSQHTLESSCPSPGQASDILEDTRETSRVSK